MSKITKMKIYRLSMLTEIATISVRQDFMQNDISAIIKLVAH